MHSTKINGTSKLISRKHFLQPTFILEVLHNQKMQTMEATSHNIHTHRLVNVIGVMHWTSSVAIMLAMVYYIHAACDKLS